LTIFGCAFASLAWLTPHIGHFYATFLILGLVGNGTAQMAYSRAVSTWFSRRLGLALAFLMTGAAFGATILPPIAQALIDRLGWRGAYAAFGGMVLALGLPMVTVFVREKPGARSVRGNQAPGASVREGLRSRVFWILVTVLFLSSIAINSAVTHLSALLTDRGISPADAAIAVSAMGAASLVGRLTTGWLLDRFFAPRVAFIVLLLATLGVSLLADARSLFVGVSAAILIGLGMGGEADFTPYLLSKYFGLRSFTTLYGFTWTAYAIAGAIGPVLMGKAFDTTSSYSAYVLKISALIFVSAALMLLLPSYRERQFPAVPEPVKVG
jgi:cyanate permease